jgi:hypothetical protein
VFGEPGRRGCAPRRRPDKRPERLGSVGLRDLVPGTILLAEDTTGKGHISRVTGTDEMLVLIVTLGDTPSD